MQEVFFAVMIAFAYGLNPREGLIAIPFLVHSLRSQTPGISRSPKTRPNALTKQPRPAPPTWHVSLEPTDRRRIFAIGDVHGCTRELEELVELAQATPDATQIVFVGDIVNKGPDSVGCLHVARRLGSLAVRGNHEELALRAIRALHEDGERPPDGLSWVERLALADIEWMSALPYTLRVPHLDAIVVHAGLHPDLPLDAQLADTMVNVREFDPVARSAFKKRPDDGSAEATVPIASVWRGPDALFFGHDARRGLQRYPLALGLDTGCVYGKCLTGVYLDRPEELFQVKAHCVYCKPNAPD